MQKQLTRTNNKQKVPFVFCFYVMFLALAGHSQGSYLSFESGEKRYFHESTIPTRTVISSDNSGIKLKYEFSAAYLTHFKVEDKDYDFLNIEGLHKNNGSGEPALPVLNERIALPEGALPKITIISTEYFDYHGYYIYPAQKPVVDAVGFPVPEFYYDKNIYNTQAFFPAKVVDLVSLGKNRRTGIANIEICPVQFNPVTETIRVFTNLVVEIAFTNGIGSFDYVTQENSTHYTEILKRMVVNSDVIRVNNNINNAENSGKNYIIITNSEFITQANKLANWKRQLGYSVEVISQESWTALEVRSAISERYNNWIPRPDYFVIIGDHNGDMAVPAMISYDPENGDRFVTDLYFACMDGNADYFPDIAHGRISASTQEEASIIVSKIIDYEKTPTVNASFYENVLFCAQYQDDDNNGYADRRYCHTSEEARDYLKQNYDYSATRIYYSSTTANFDSLRYNNGYFSDGQLLPKIMRSVYFNWNGDADDICYAINNGQFLVYHRDHGFTDGSGWAHPRFTSSNLSGLHNYKKNPVVLSINCYSGMFNKEDCFAENILKMEDYGAVGVVAASFFSYSGLNDAFSDGLIDAIWADPGLYPDFGTAGNYGSYTIGVGNSIYSMGDVLNLGLYAMSQNYSDNKYSYEIFNYFGDPSMKIWTSNPNYNKITADYTQELDCDDTCFSISGSTANAMATLLFNNELLSKITLDDDGNGSIYFQTDKPGKIILTISKHNCKPLIDSIIVTCSGYPPYLTTYSTTATTDVSTILKGEIYTDNGSSVIESGFIYCTNPDPVIGDSGIIQVSTSPVVTCGSLSLEVTGLNDSTGYYYKSYAINNNGTGYGNQKFVKTLFDDITVNNDAGEITIFPNPNNGTFVINIPENQKAFISITNFSGISVFKKSMETSEETIDISFCKEGLYLLQIKTENSVYTEKIIIK